MLIIIDVARPDKISGADINAICQEVCFFFNMQSTSTPHAGVVLSTSVVKTLNCSHDHSIPILSWDKIHHGGYPVTVLKNVYDFM